MRRFFKWDTMSEVGPAVARVGAIAAIVIAALAVAIIATKPRGNYEVEAVFDTTRGLIKGGEVTAGFQKVGTVSNVTLGNDGLPRVTMRIDGDFALHQGAFADIRLMSNVGAVNRVVDLQQGDPEAPELEDGDTLGPSQTDEPVDLDLAFSTLDPKTRADAGRVLAGLDNATRGRGKDINRLLQHSSQALNETANALGQVTTDGAALRSLVHDTSTVIGALAADPQALGGAAERTATLLQIADERQDEVRRTADALGPALKSGRLTLQNLDSAVPDLRGLVHEARPLVQRLAPVAENLPETFKPLRPTIKDARELIEKSRGYAVESEPAIRDSIPLVKGLDPTLKLLNPFLDDLRVRAPEAVSFFGVTGDALGNYDVNGHLLRFIPRVIQVPLFTNPIGPSDSGSGSLPRPFIRTPGSIAGEPWDDYASSFIGGARDASEYAIPAAPTAAGTATGTDRLGQPSLFLGGGQ